MALDVARCLHFSTSANDVKYNTTYSVNPPDYGTRETPALNKGETNRTVSRSVICITEQLDWFNNGSGIRGGKFYIVVYMYLEVPANHPF